MSFLAKVRTWCPLCGFDIAPDDLCTLLDGTKVHLAGDCPEIGLETP